MSVHSLRARRGRIAWVTVPHLGGLVTVHATLRPGLERLGWNIFPVWAGALPSGAFSERCHGIEVLAAGSSDMLESAREFVRWVESQSCDIVFTAGEPFVLAALPALPAGTRVVAKCPAQSRHAYRLVTSDLSRTDLVLVETQRQYNDLTRSWRVPEARCRLIANGVQVEAFQPLSIKDFAGPIRLVYTGRLDEATKHVMLLPEIGRGLARNSIPFDMTILGDGPDRRRLEHRVDSYGLASHIRLLGSIPRTGLPQLLGDAHVAIIPSRLDGMSWALLESMACGCVPVASLIHETTDTVVRHGENGFLCRMGDARAFAKAIAILANDRARLKAASLAARETIVRRFAADRMIEAHDLAFAQLLNRSPRNVSSTSLTAMNMPRTYKPSWHSHVPRAIRNAARTWAQRLGLTV